VFILLSTKHSRVYSSHHSLSGLRVTVRSKMALAATWKVAIQNASLPTVQAMIRQSKACHDGEQAALTLPMLKVLKDCFPPHLQERATNLLGIEFGSLAGSCFIDMTPLQLSLIMQHVYHATSESESRVQITELLLAVRQTKICPTPFYFLFFFFFLGALWYFGSICFGGEFMHACMCYTSV